MLRVLRVELEKLLYSRLLYASMLLFLGYAAIMLLGFRSLTERLGAGPESQSGAMYFYIAFSLAFYPFVGTVAIVFAGGAVSPELRDGTLRYALLAPVRRATWLLARFLVVAVAVAVVIAFLFLAVAGIGLLLLGPGNVVTYDLWGGGKPAPRSPTLLSDEEVLLRCLLAVPPMVLSALGVASPAFLVSTLLDNPLVAVTIPVSLFFISSIIQFSQFLPQLKPYLPTRYMFCWDEVFSRSIDWHALGVGLAANGGLVALFLALAIVLFSIRDVRS